MNKKDQPHTYASCGNPLDCSLCLANPMRKQTLCQQCGRVESIMTFSPTLKKDEQILCVECREKTIEKDQQKCTSCYGKKYYTQLTRYGEDKYRNEKIECPRCKGTGKEPIQMPSMVLVGKPRKIHDKSCCLIRPLNKEDCVCACHYSHAKEECPKRGQHCFNKGTGHTCKECCFCKPKPICEHKVEMAFSGPSDIYPLPVCKKCGSIVLHGIITANQPQEEKTEWKMDFEKVFQKMLQCLYGGEEQEYEAERMIKSFIITRLKSEREKAYQEGVKDGEGTKNGVKRYQMGYNDAIRECVEMIKRISVDCECDSCLSGFNKGEATKIIYSTELNKKLQDLLEKKI